MKLIRSLRPAPFAYAVLLSLALWAIIVYGTRTAFAADPLAWGRTYAAADSLVVPVRWNASCDALGCADSYRVTWTLRERAAVVANPPRTSAPSAPSPAPSVKELVLREVTLAGTGDSVRVPLPAIGQPREVCVYVTALRRGLSSDVRAACRTVEAPDKAPPAVDSIKWDSLGVRTQPPSDSVVMASGRILHGAYQYRIASDTAAWSDSLPLPLTDGRTSTARPTWTVQMCAVAPHRDGVTQVVLVPQAMASDAQASAYVTRCTQAARALFGVAVPLQAWRAPIAFSDGDVVLAPGAASA